VEEIGERNAGLKAGGLNRMNEGTAPLCRKKGCTRPAMLNKNGKVVNGWCRECWLKRAKKARKMKAEVRPTSTVVLDFSARPELLEALRAAAEAEFRSAEQQALFLISEGL